MPEFALKVALVIFVTKLIDPFARRAAAAWPLTVRAQQVLTIQKVDSSIPAPDASPALPALVAGYFCRTWWQGRHARDIVVTSVVGRS